MVPVPPPDTCHQSPVRLIAGLVLASLAVATPLVPALAEDCPSKGNPRLPAYQKREQMLRCEGESPKPIAATGLWLDNFTIGSPRSRTSSDDGREILLRVPVIGRSSAKPEVTVETSRNNYKMKPLEWRQRGDNWQEFAWGVAVLNQLGIKPAQLRATALLPGGGGASRQLPVWFADARAYTLIVGSNTPLRLRLFRVKGPDGRVVEDFLSGGTDARRAIWDARRLPRGIYTIEAQADDPSTKPLITAVQHDPRWLQP
ncbi:MAG: hypothetical protein ACK587_13325 [Cyanobacteriota bacterium]